MMDMADTHKAHTHKAWRLHAHNDLRFEDVETPKPAADGVVVAIEAGMVLSYTGKVLSGSVPYSLPPMPFVPGTNAIARVVAVGNDVTHVRAGDRVFLSPHLRGDVPALAAAGLLDLRKIVVTKFKLADFRQAVDAAALMQGLDLTAVVP
jgi:NADPH:quinone reductase-like Zn-dependent oxidoreductase